MSQNFFQIIRPFHVHLKMDKVDLKKRPPWKKKFCIFFSIDSSSRHEKRCQMLQRLFWLFQCSKNPQWVGIFNFSCQNSIRRYRRHKYLGIMPIHSLQSDKKNDADLWIYECFFRNYFCPLWSSSLSEENGFWLQFSGCYSPLSWLNFLFYFKFRLASSLTVISFLHRCWSMSACGFPRKISPKNHLLNVHTYYIYSI